VKTVHLQKVTVQTIYKHQFARAFTDTYISQLSPMQNLTHFLWNVNFDSFLTSTFTSWKWSLSNMQSN